MTKQEERQRIIDMFNNAVYLYDDKIVLTFNYKDGTKTITLDEIKESFGSDLCASGAPGLSNPVDRIQMRSTGFRLM